MNDDFQYRMKALFEVLEKGQVKIAAHLKERFETSLNAVKRNPDGLFDPASVDTFISSLSFSISVVNYENSLRNISLKEIQKEYFEIVNRFFGGMYKEMLRNSVNPHLIACDASSRPGLLQSFISDSGNIFDAINLFWEIYSDNVNAHIQDLNCLKATYNGDIFPSYTHDIISSTGLYMDTTILCCPLIKVCNFAKIGMDSEKLLYYFVKHGLNLLKYQDLVLAETDFPIVVIAPLPSSINRSNQDLFYEMSKCHWLTHACKLFDKSFLNQEELSKYTSSFKNVEDLANSIKDPSRLLFDTEWQGKPKDLILQNSRELFSSFPNLPLSLDTISSSILGRFASSCEAIYTSEKLGATPVLDVPTSWQYLNWTYEYSNKPANVVGSPKKDLLINHELIFNSSNKLKLLTNLSHNSLIDLRKHGALSELRAILNSAFTNFNSQINDTATDLTSEIIDSINQAFSKHQTELNQIKTDKQKLWGCKILPSITVNSMNILLSTQDPIGGLLLGFVTSIYSPFSFDLAGINFAYQEWRNLKDKHIKSGNSAAGILIRSANRVK